MTDIIGLYLNPPENALVLSVDEKTSIQALGKKHPSQPMEPGKPERVEIIENHFPNKELVDSIMKFIKQYNKEAKIFRWTYTGAPLRI